MLKVILSTIGVAFLVIGFVILVSGVKKDKLGISVIGCILVIVGSIISAFYVAQ